MSQFRFVPLGEDPEFISNGNAFNVIDTSTNEVLGIIVEMNNVFCVVSSDNANQFEEKEFSSREEAAKYLQTR